MSCGLRSNRFFSCAAWEFRCGGGHEARSLGGWLLLSTLFQDPTMPRGLAHLSGCVDATIHGREA